MLVGMRGWCNNGSDYGSGGGGASVVLKDNPAGTYTFAPLNRKVDVLFVAGGGGGCLDSSFGNATYYGLDAVTSNGTNTNGGTSSHTRGGAGLTGNGAGGSGGNQAYAILSGTPSHTTLNTTHYGGWGGGGGSYDGGGSGGGYSGGNSRGNGAGGSGGTSYINPSLCSEISRGYATVEADSERNLTNPWTAYGFIELELGRDESKYILAKDSEGYKYFDGAECLDGTVRPIFTNQWKLIDNQSVPEEITYKDLHFLSIPESYIDTAIRNLQISSDTECIINAGSGKVIVKLRGHNHQEIDGISKVLVSAFKENYLGDNIADEAKLIVDLLNEKKQTVSFAESCTGGLLSEYITNISGASAVFMGSVVSYDNSVKQNVLNVPKDILKEYGAVSAECASFMANGVKDLMKTDYSVSVTGIAGPFGATDTKPVGLVYIGTACKNGTSVYKNIFNGDRQQIRMRSAKKAMFHLLNMIKGKQNGNI